MDETDEYGGEDEFAKAAAIARSPANLSNLIERTAQEVPGWARRTAEALRHYRDKDRRSLMQNICVLTKSIVPILMLATR